MGKVVGGGRKGKTGKKLWEDVIGYSEVLWSGIQGNTTFKKK